MLINEKSEFVIIIDLAIIAWRYQHIFTCSFQLKELTFCGLESLTVAVKKGERCIKMGSAAGEAFLEHRPDMTMKLGDEFLEFIIQSKHFYQIIQQHMFMTSVTSM